MKGNSDNEKISCSRLLCADASYIMLNQDRQGLRLLAGKHRKTGRKFSFDCGIRHPAVTTENPPEIPDTSGLTQVGERLWEIALPDYLSDAAQPYTLYNLSARGNYLLATFMDNPNTSEPSDLAVLLLFDIRTGKLTAETRHSSDARFSLLDDGYVLGYRKLDPPGADT